MNETLYADLPFGTWYYLLALGLRLPQCLWNNFKPEARPKLRPERDQIYARSEPKFTPEANPRPTDELIFFRGVGFSHQPASDPRGAWPWLTGRFIGAKEAMAWGLVNRVLPPQQLMPHCLDLAKEMSKMHLDMRKRGRGQGLWQVGWTAPWVFVVAWSKVIWRTFKIWSKPTYLKFLKITDETWLTGAVGFVEWTLIYGWKVWHVVSFYCLIGRSLNQGTSNGTSGKCGANYLEFCWSHCLCGVCFK